MRLFDIRITSCNNIAAVCLLGSRDTGNSNCATLRPQPSRLRVARQCASQDGENTAPKPKTLFSLIRKSSGQMCDSRSLSVTRKRKTSEFLCIRPARETLVAWLECRKNGIQSAYPTFGVTTIHTLSKCTEKCGTGPGQGVTQSSPA